MVLNNRYIRFVFLELLLLSGILFPSYTMGQAPEHLLKAGFIEKFTHFVEWPASAQGGSEGMKIAVFGKSRIEPALREIFAKTKNPDVSIIDITSVNEIEGCKIVFISNSVSQEILRELLQYTKGKPVMTISDTKGYCNKGVLLNMLVVDNYVRYEINKSVLDVSGLKMSSLLLNSAIIIEK